MNASGSLSNVHARVSLVCVLLRIVSGVTSSMPRSVTSTGAAGSLRSDVPLIDSVITDAVTRSVVSTSLTVSVPLVLSGSSVSSSPAVSGPSVTTGAWFVPVTVIVKVPSAVAVPSLTVYLTTVVACSPAARSSKWSSGSKFTAPLLPILALPPSSGPGVSWRSASTSCPTLAGSPDTSVTSRSVPLGPLGSVSFARTPVAIGSAKGVSWSVAPVSGYAVGATFLTVTSKTAVLELGPLSTLSVTWTVICRLVATSKFGTVSSSTLTTPSWSIWNAPPASTRRPYVTPGRLSVERTSRNVAVPVGAPSSTQLGSSAGSARSSSTGTVGGMPSITIWSWPVLLPILVSGNVGTSVSTLLPASSCHTAFKPLATASASWKPARVVSPKATTYTPV